MSKVDIKFKFNNREKLMIFSVVAFLCTIIAATYAWISHDFFGSSSNMSITSIGLNLSFRGTSPEIIADLAPGESVYKTFSVQNTTGTSQTFNLFWSNMENNFANKNYFMYELLDDDNEVLISSPKYLPTSVSIIEENIIIPGNTIRNFKLKITFVNDLLNDQSSSEDLFFWGDLNISITNVNSTLLSKLNIYVDGVASATIPNLSSYNIDTTKTYCTEGSSISVVNNALEIANQVASTKCDVYFTSSAPSVSTQEEYNLLIIEEDDNTYAAATNYYYRGEDIDLGIPVKEGHAFLGWTVTGGGTTLEGNTKVTMGSTYSYARANWTEGYWIKTVHTCNQNAPATYNREYKTCQSNNAGWTSYSKTCIVSQFQKDVKNCIVVSETRRTATCGRSVASYTSTCKKTTTEYRRCDDFSCPCGLDQCDIINGNYCCGEYTVTHTADCRSNGTCPQYYSGSCSPNYSYALTNYDTDDTIYSPGTCSEYLFDCNRNYYGSTYANCVPTYGFTNTVSTSSTTCSTSGSVDTCTATGDKNIVCIETDYDFDDIVEVPNLESCTENIISCGASTKNQINTECVNNNVYSFTSVVSDPNLLIGTCDISEFECGIDTVGHEFTTLCTIASTGYGFINVSNNQNYCFADTSLTCIDSTDADNVYTSCELISP